MPRSSRILHVVPIMSINSSINQEQKRNFLILYMTIYKTRALNILDMFHIEFQSNFVTIVGVPFLIKLVILYP